MVLQQIKHNDFFLNELYYCVWVKQNISYKEADILHQFPLNQMSH